MKKRLIILFIAFVIVSGIYCYMLSQKITDPKLMNLDSVTVDEKIEPFNEENYNMDLDRIENEEKKEDEVKKVNKSGQKGKTSKSTDADEINKALDDLIDLSDLDI